MRLSKARLYPQRQAEKAICYSLMELLCHDCTEQMVTNQGQEEEGRNALWGPRFCDSNVFGASESDSVNELEGFNQATMVAAPQTFLNFSNRKKSSSTHQVVYTRSLQATNCNGGENSGGWTEQQSGLQWGVPLNWRFYPTGPTVIPSSDKDVATGHIHAVAGRQWSNRSDVVAGGQDVRQGQSFQAQSQFFSYNSVLR